MAQSFNYPAVAVTVPGGLDVNVHDASGNPISSTAGALDVNATLTDPSVGATGSPVPASAAFIGGENPSGDLQGLMVSAARQLLVDSSTLATQATLAAMSAKLPATLGQKAMAASMAVAIASDQSAIAVSSATLATEATLSALSAKFGSLGQKAMAGSAPVVIASDQSAVPVSAASLPLPSGAATETTLAALSAKFGSLGQKAMAGSAPVVIASDQSAISVISGANLNGSNTDSTVSTVATLTAPANSVGFILMNLDTSSANIRWRIGATATSSSGQQLQPGRDTGFVPCGANISICAESGTQNYNVQWILSS